MKVLRIYRTKGSAIVCKSYPAIDTGDGSLSPSEFAPVTLTVNPNGSQDLRFVVRADRSVGDKFVMDEIRHFINTLQLMYDL